MSNVEMQIYSHVDQVITEAFQAAEQRQTEGKVQLLQDVQAALSLFQE